MTQRNVVCKTTLIWLAFAALLLSPAGARAKKPAAIPRGDGDYFQDLQDAQDKEQERRDREQEARDREQEKRDREQEKRDREQEVRDREQERRDRQQELYDNGREALDDERYEQAEAKFNQLAQMNGAQTDAALYWKAYAENRLGKKSAALATIADLKAKYAQSRWKKDAEALELEVKSNIPGQKPDPDAES